MQPFILMPGLSSIGCLKQPIMPGNSRIGCLEKPFKFTLMLDKSRLTGHSSLLVARVDSTFYAVFGFQKLKMWKIDKNCFTNFRMEYQISILCLNDPKVYGLTYSLCEKIQDVTLCVYLI